MNYLRNLLRRLWPFVTRREHEELKTWVRKLESKYNVLETKLQGLDTDMCAANADIQVYKTVAINNYAELAVEVARLKKPSRKKPAKKGKKK